MCYHPKSGHRRSTFPGLIKPPVQKIHAILAEKWLVFEDHAWHALMACCGARVGVGFNNRFQALGLWISLDLEAAEIQTSARDGV